MPLAQLQQRMARFVEMREALVQQTDQRVTTADGDEVSVTEAGSLRATLIDEHEESEVER